MDGKKVESKDFVTPPCSDACPAGVNVPRYIRAVKNKDYDQALAVLREKLPLPFVCADACFAPCESQCAYRQFGEPLAIRDLKRVIVENASDAWKKKQKIAKKTGKKAAIVGSGPAGLTVAYYLSVCGHEVTLFDEFDKPGGLLRYAIPRYRIPEEHLDKDVQVIMDMGVNFKGGIKVGSDISLSKLKEEYDAVFVSTGACKSTQIPVEGTDKKGVFWGLDFLEDVAMEKAGDISGNVVVIGGGNVAIDAAMTAKRKGADTVYLVYRRTREEMPAHAWEIEMALKEGILLMNSWGPKEIIGSDKAEGVKLQACAQVCDESGRFHLTYDEGIIDTLSAETVILAVGQTTDLTCIKDDSCNINQNGDCLQVNPETLATDEDGVFAGGDVVTGPLSIIDAIGQGRKGAQAIDKFLGGSGSIEEALAKAEKEVWLPELDREPRARKEGELEKPWKRSLGFDQIEKCMSKKEATQEASRCLNCDARKFEVVLNTDFCKECGYCALVCGLNIFTPADFFNEKGIRPMVAPSSDRCVGCFNCYYSCPDFAIDIIEA